MHRITTKPGLLAALAVAILLIGRSLTAAQAPQPRAPEAIDNSFTYQGQLRSGGSPANAACDFQFSLWNAASSGTQQGVTQSWSNVSVVNGLFTVPLNLGNQFTGDERWLQILVKCAGESTFTTLNPRQKLTAAPYALSLRPGARIEGAVPSDAGLRVTNTNVGSGHGVYGVSTSGFGVYGTSSNGGVVGSGYVGVQGMANGTTDSQGVRGEDGANGASTTTWAGVFNGRLLATNLIKLSGSFRIDHPLDPANKYLFHSFVESPDMKNIYDGVVTLGAGGEAIVSLPAYFEALNMEFRYQLTCIGGYAPVYIAEEIAGNQFKIAGGTPGLKVSWQVTGTRHDPYANENRIKVEEDKPPHERGRYVYPRGYGLAEEMGVPLLQPADVPAADAAPNAAQPGGR